MPEGTMVSQRECNIQLHNCNQRFTNIEKRLSDMEKTQMTQTEGITKLIGMINTVRYLLLLITILSIPAVAAALPGFWKWFH